MTLPLKLGSRDPQPGSPSVRELQLLLNSRLGAGTVTVDGGFGAQTESVVKRFQQLKDLVSDGIVGAKTWTALYTPPQTDPTPAIKPFKQRKIGAYVETSSGGTLWSLKPLSEMEQKLGHKFSIVSGFCQAGDLSDLKSNMITVAEQGRTTLLSYDVQFKFVDIINGRYDSTFVADAKAAQAVKGPIVLRLWAEMNGDWATWSVGQGNVTSQAQWISAWRHIRNIFKTFTNVQFCWCPNVTDEGSYKLEGYYPGAEYVDLLGFDGYNWGQENWQTHSQVYSPIYKRLVALGTQPIWIGETASAEGTAGQKGEWVRALLNSTEFPRIEALAWFSVKKERTWQIDSSTASLQAFKELLP